MHSYVNAFGYDVVMKSPKYYNLHENTLAYCAKRVEAFSYHTGDGKLFSQPDKRQGPHVHATENVTTGQGI